MLQHFFGFVYLSAVSQLVNLTGLYAEHSLHGMSLDMFLAFAFFEIK